MNRNKNKTKANPEEMFSGTDLLHMNQFIEGNVDDVPNDKAQDYKRHYEENNGNSISSSSSSSSSKPVVFEKLTRTKLYDVAVTEEPNFSKGPNNINDHKVKLKTIRRNRKVYIDSAYRDKGLYPDASDMKVSWGRTFTNVISMKLNSMEFSNVSQVVSGTTNKIYWINREDEDLAEPYPVYSAELLVGSYTFTAIQAECVDRLNVIKRHNNERSFEGTTAPFHFFKMDIIDESDYVNFTSIIAKLAPVNPITTVSGDSRVIFQFPDHGFDDKELIHIIGVRGILGGIQSSKFNSSFEITVINVNSFEFNISDIFIGDVTGGGSLVKAGREADFQLLMGYYNDEYGNTFNAANNETVGDVLGFRLENSSDTIQLVEIEIDPQSLVETEKITEILDPITSVSLVITAVNTSKVLGTRNTTQIVSINHGLQPGDRIYLNHFQVTPSVYTSERHRGTFEVFSVPSPDIITIRWYTEHITDISNAFIGTQIMRMNYPGHGFNRIVEIIETAANVISITTLFPHGFETGFSIRLKNTNSVPNMDGYYRDIQVIDTDTFTVSNALNVLSPEILPLTVSVVGYNGILLSDLKFYLYNVTPFGGFLADELNNKEMEIRYVLDDSNFTFTTRYGFSKTSQQGGGSSVRISSKLHGWEGHHDNSPNGILNRPVKLSGDNSAFLCIQNLNSDSVSSNTPVRDIFAKLFITANPGLIIFNQFDAADLEFVNPIPQLDELHFQIRSPNNEITSFGGLDYSFGLEVVEELQIDDSNNVFGNRVFSNM
jgi:hypothetical protein